MNIYFDTEFTGLHKDTTLISIGLISEDGKIFYAEFNDYDESQCDDWIKENVIEHLKYNDKKWHSSGNVISNDVSMKGNKYKIAFELCYWLSQFDSVQLVSDVCHYDMVLFIDIFGSPWDLPKNVSPVCHDINQDIAELFVPSQIKNKEKIAFDLNREEILLNHGIEIKGDKHNSLYDAKVIREIYKLTH